MFHDVFSNMHQNMGRWRCSSPWYQSSNQPLHSTRNTYFSLIVVVVWDLTIVSKALGLRSLLYFKPCLYAGRLSIFSDLVAEWIVYILQVEFIAMPRYQKR